MSNDLSAGIASILRPDGSTAGTSFISDEGLSATCAHVVEATRAGLGSSVRLVFHVTGEERKTGVEPDGWRTPTAEDVAILWLGSALPKGIVAGGGHGWSLRGHRPHH